MMITTNTSVATSLLAVALTSCVSIPKQTTTDDPIDRVISFIRQDQAKNHEHALAESESACPELFSGPPTGFIHSINAKVIKPGVSRAYVVYMGICGGTARWQYLLVEQRGKLKEIDLHTPGDIESVYPNQQGQLEVTVMQFADNDPHCCPSKPAKVIVQLD